MTFHRFASCFCLLAMLVVVGVLPRYGRSKHAISRVRSLSFCLQAMLANLDVLYAGHSALPTHACAASDTRGSLRGAMSSLGLDGRSANTGAAAHVDSDSDGDSRIYYKRQLLTRSLQVCLRRSPLPPPLHCFMHRLPCPLGDHACHLEERICSSGREHVHQTHTVFTFQRSVLLSSTGTK